MRTGPTRAVHCRNATHPHECDAQRQAAAHASGELRRLHVERIAVQLHPLSDLLNYSCEPASKVRRTSRPRTVQRTSLLLAGSALEPRVEQQVLSNGEVRPHSVELRANTQDLVHAVHLCIDVEPCHGCPPPGRFEEAG